MTKSEEQALTRLSETVRKIGESYMEFTKNITSQVEDLSAKVEKKHLPLYHEQDILRTAQTAIASAIEQALKNDYQSPVKKLVASVVEENETELRTLISDSFTQVIRTADFKQSIVNAFSHKVARSIISSNDGLFDTVSNELKKDAVFKAKMSIAVANVVNECLLDTASGNIKI